MYFESVQVLFLSLYKDRLKQVCAIFADLQSVLQIKYGKFSNDNPCLTVTDHVAELNKAMFYWI